MAYLVVMVVDNSPHEAGDVISWRDESILSESGHYGIGTATLQDERFKIVHIPDMTTGEANTLCRPQAGLRREKARDGTVTEANPDAKIRAWNFNVSNLSVDKKSDIDGVNKLPEERFRMKLDDTPEMLDVINLEMTKAESDTVLELKPVIDNREGAFVREIT